MSINIDFFIFQPIVFGRQLYLGWMWQFLPESNYMIYNFFGVLFQFNEKVIVIVYILVHMTKTFDF